MKGVLKYHAGTYKYELDDSIKNDFNYALVCECKMEFEIIDPFDNMMCIVFSLNNYIGQHNVLSIKEYDNDDYSSYIFDIDDQKVTLGMLCFKLINKELKQYYGEDLTNKIKKVFVKFNGSLSSIEDEICAKNIFITKKIDKQNVINFLRNVYLLLYKRFETSPLLFFNKITAMNNILTYNILEKIIKSLHIDSK